MFFFGKGEMQNVLKRKSMYFGIFLNVFTKLNLIILIIHNSYRKNNKKTPNIFVGVSYKSVFVVQGGGGGQDVADMSATNRILFIDAFPNMYIYIYTLSVFYR